MREANSQSTNKANGQKQVYKVLVAGGAFIILVAILILTASPKQYDLKVGDIAPKTITATKDVIDEITTAQNRQRAADAVQSVYQLDNTAVDKVMSSISQVFQQYEDIRVFGASHIQDDASGSSAGSYSRDVLDYAKGICTLIDLSDWQVTILMTTDEETLGNLYITTCNAVQSAMESSIREGQLEAAVTGIQRQIILYTSSDLCWNLAVPAVRACLTPNMTVNQEVTESNRQAARDAVEATYYQSGQNIVVAGERINAAQLAVLESLGLLEGNRFDITVDLGVMLLVGLTFLMVFFAIIRFEKAFLKSLQNLLLVAVISLISVGACLAVAQLNPYLIPISMTVILCAALTSPQIAFIMNMAIAVFSGMLSGMVASVFTQQCLCIILATILSGPVIIHLVCKRRQRATVLISGVCAAGINLLTMLGIGLLINNSLNEVMINALWAAGGGMLSAVLCIGIQPVLEYLFNLATPYRLLELSNPNQPLLRQLLVETPGTYHHSIMVANLAEAAAEAIGADTLLVRTGAYYHDIGKLKRPQYFKENQVGENPHDFTEARVSAAIILSHVTDGAAIARKYRLPQQIINCIEQHHGTTFVTYFYAKANKDSDAPVDMTEFTYPGPKPQSIETGILMLADTVEAAIRSVGESTAEQIEENIRRLVKDKIDSGQLDMTELTLQDVEKICSAFAKVLNGIYHKRIEYPKINPLGKETKLS